jgi:hypothetical protein
MRLDDPRLQASEDYGEPLQDGGEKVFHSQGSLNARRQRCRYLVAIACAAELN